MPSSVLPEAANARNAAQAAEPSKCRRSCLRARLCCNLLLLSLVAISKNPVHGQGGSSSAALYITQKGHTLAECGDDPLVYQSFETERCYFPRSEQLGFKYSCSDDKIAIMACEPPGGLPEPSNNSSSLPLNYTNTSSHTTSTTPAPTSTPPVLDPNRTTIAVHLNETTSLPTSSMSMETTPPPGPDLPDPLRFNSTRVCRELPGASEPWHGVTDLGPTADVVFESLRCGDLLFSDQGIWCGAEAFEQDDCSGPKLASSFSLPLDRCSPQPGFVGTYWERYTLDATGNLTFQRQCIDSRCRTCQILAPLPSPPDSPPVLSQPLRQCVAGVIPALAFTRAQSQSWLCIDVAPETVPPTTTPRPRLMPPPPPSVTIRMVVLGETRCLVGPTQLCLHAAKQQAMVEAMALALDVNRIYLSITDVQHASQVSFEPLAAAAAPPTHSAALRSEPSLLSEEQPTAKTRHSWQSRLPHLFLVGSSRGRSESVVSGRREGAPWLRQSSESSQCEGAGCVEQPPTVTARSRHTDASIATPVLEDGEDVGPLHGGGAGRSAAYAERLLERKQRALADTFGDGGAVYVTVRMETLTSDDALVLVVRTKVAIKDGTMQVAIADALREYRPTGDDVANITVALFGIDGAVATTANGTRLSVPPDMYPAYRDPENLDAVDTCALPASLDAYCTEHSNCFVGLFCRRNTCRPCAECRYDGDSTGESPTNPNADPPDFSCPRWNCPESPVCTNQTSRPSLCPAGCPPVYDDIWMPPQCSAMIPDEDIDEVLRERELQDDCGSRPGDFETIGGISMGLSFFFLAACGVIKGWFDRVEQRVLRDKAAMRDDVYRGPE